MKKSNTWIYQGSSVEKLQAITALAGIAGNLYLVKPCISVYGPEQAPDLPDLAGFCVDWLLIGLQCDTYIWCILEGLYSEINFAD